MIENYAKENNIPYTIEDSNVTSQTGGNWNGIVKAQGKITLPIFLNLDCKLILDNFSFLKLPSPEACILGEKFLDKYRGNIKFDSTDQKILTIQEPQSQLFIVQQLSDVPNFYKHQSC